MSNLLTFTKALQIETYCAGEEIFFALTGELDTEGAQTLDHLCADLGVDARPIVLDLGGLTFIDAAGLRSVLRLYGRCLAHHRCLRIKPAPGEIQRVFSLTRAADVLPFERDQVHAPA